MGLKSASEVYQRKIAEVIAGVPGVINMMDDCLVGGATVEEHDDRLRQVLQRCRDNGITLNAAKCHFRVTECTMFGHHISRQGISPLPSKIQAIIDMPVPRDITALRSFLGSVNYHMKFLPSLAEINRPLRQLLLKDSLREWGPEHDEAFDTIKKMLTSAPTLAWYDPRRPTRVTSDASMYGAGGVLEQLADDNEWRAVHYMSASFTSTQMRYSMVEKEACAATLACERFAMYLIGLPSFTLRTDHKPLVEILGTKPIAELSVRLQRFRMRLTPFWCNVEFIQGKSNYTADMLSRMPVTTTQPDRDILDEEVHDKVAISAVLQGMPASTPFIQKIAQAQEEDDVSKDVRKFITEGWPHYKQLTPALRQFHQHQGDLAICSNLITFRERIFIPVSHREEILSRIHAGHLPEQKCSARARDAVWWPNINKDIVETARKCATCLQHTTNRPEPLLPSAIPNHPWDVIGADIGTHDGTDYLVIIDSYSKFPIFFKMTTLTTQAVINKLRPLFEMYGSPNTLRTDRGPQFESEEFRNFASEYDFCHIRSSPHYAQSNGLAEAGVKIIKTVLKKNPQNPGLALMEYRATPNSSGYSPAQLFLSRNIKTRLPSIKKNYQPEVPPIAPYRRYLEHRTKSAKANYDARHRAADLPPLDATDKVWVSDARRHGTVLRAAPEPRAYVIQTQDGGQLVRNRRFLVRCPTPTPTPRDDAVPATAPTLTRQPVSGRAPSPSTTEGLRRSRRQHKPTQKCTMACCR